MAELVFIKTGGHRTRLRLLYIFLPRERFYEIRPSERFITVAMSSATSESVSIGNLTKRLGFKNAKLMLRCFREFRKSRFTTAEFINASSEDLIVMVGGFLESTGKDYGVLRVGRQSILRSRTKFGIFSSTYSGSRDAISADVSKK